MCSGTCRPQPALSPARGDTRLCANSGKVAAAKRLEEVLKNMDSFVQLKTMGADLADNLSRFLSAET